MNRALLATQVAPLAVIAGLSACSGGRDAITADFGARVAQAQSVFEGPVPRAQCGPDDLAEPGLQGRFATADRLFSAATGQGFSCNLSVKGRYAGDGANWQVAWHDDCAYYDTGVYPEYAFQPPRPSPGTVVIDASNPADPMAAAYLTTTPIMNPHEALKAHAGREMLGAIELGGSGFDLYDVSDCARPQLLASAVMPPDYIGHEGDFAADGQTYYLTSTNQGDGGVSAIDIADPTKPQPLVHELLGNTHGISTNAAGTRGYLADLAAGSNSGMPLTDAAASAGSGMLVVDLSAVQDRRPDPAMTILGSVQWTDGGAAQHTIPVFYDGQPYIIFVDEGGVLSRDVQIGGVRFIDIADETTPRVVSKLRLEIQMWEPEARSARQEDCDSEPLFCYQTHYCGVDRTENPTVLGCSNQNSGIRIYDIRDPLQPSEIAYFVPPPRPATLGSGHLGGRTADWCAANVRFVPERAEVWSICMDYGFFILKFRDGVWPFPG